MVDAVAVACFTRSFSLRTTEHDAVHDVTREVQRILAESGVQEGVCTVFTPHATAAITINENDDPNIGVDLPGGLPYQPWLVPIVKKRTENNAIDDPHIRCLPDNFLRAYGLPHLLKFVHSPGLLVVLNEMNAGYRQVFTDGRALPKDPNPTWQGYSSATWSGDTLDVDTVGFRDDTWIDWSGSVLTEAARVREEIRRPDFGHLEIRVTVDDPKAYTKPWSVTLKQRIMVDTELIDEVCLENEKFGTLLK